MWQSRVETSKQSESYTPLQLLLSPQNPIPIKTVPVSRPRKQTKNQQKMFLFMFKSKKEQYIILGATREQNG